MRILLADDSAVARMLGTQLLSRWGHEVIAVEDGRAALQALEADDRPDLAILDWEMPEATGPEICRHVKSADAVESPYLILLTGRESDEDSIAALEAGADDFLTKPYKPHDLRARVGLGARVVSLNHRLREQAEALDALRSENQRLRAAATPGVDG